jgi:hypothetical protein
MNLTNKATTDTPSLLLLQHLSSLSTANTTSFKSIPRIFSVHQYDPCFEHKELFVVKKCYMFTSFIPEQLVTDYIRYIVLTSQYR